MCDTETITAQDFNQDELRKLEETARTANSFSETDVREMGKRAKARKRAAKLASENVEPNVISDETDCEIPSTDESVASRPSKIPVFQRGSKSSSSVTGSMGTMSSLTTNSGVSRIPRPKARLVYLNAEATAENNTETTENISLTSYTGDEASYATSDMVTVAEGETCRDYIEPIPHCDLSTESAAITPSQESIEQPEQLTLIGEGGGVEVQLNLSALVAGMNIEVAGIKIV